MIAGDSATFIARAEDSVSISISSRLHCRWFSNQDLLRRASNLPALPKAGEGSFSATPGTE